MGGKKIKIPMELKAALVMAMNVRKREPKKQPKTAKKPKRAS